MSVLYTENLMQNNCLHEHISFLITTNFLIITSVMVYNCRKYLMLFALILLWKQEIVYQFFFTNIGLLNRYFLVHPLLLIILLSVNTKVYVINIRLKKIIKVLNSGLFLSFGYFILILIGGVWAQQEFNWGGWWSWDIIEVTSVLLFLVLLVFIHDKKHNEPKIKKLNWFLYWLSFLSLFYFINRLNIFTSIHSFTSAHNYIYCYFILIGVGILLFFYKINFLFNLRKSSLIFYNSTNFICFYYFYCFVYQFNIFSIPILTFFTNTVIIILTYFIFNSNFFFFLKKLHNLYLVLVYWFLLSFNNIFTLFYKKSPQLTFYFINMNLDKIIFFDLNLSGFFLQNLNEFVFFKPINYASNNVLMLMFPAKHLSLIGVSQILKWYWF